MFKGNISASETHVKQRSQSFPFGESGENLSELIITYFPLGANICKYLRVDVLVSKHYGRLLKSALLLVFAEYPRYYQVPTDIKSNLFWYLNTSLWNENGRAVKEAATVNKARMANRKLLGGPHFTKCSIYYSLCQIWEEKYKSNCRKTSNLKKHLNKSKIKKRRYPAKTPLFNAVPTASVCDWCSAASNMSIIIIIIILFPSDVGE